MKYLIRSTVHMWMLFMVITMMLVVVIFGMFNPAMARPSANVETASPKVVFEAWFPGLTIDAAFTDVLLVRDFPKGSGTGVHQHGGPALIMTTDGAFTTHEENIDRRYTAGESFTEKLGHTHEGFNDEDTPARIIASYLLTEGAKVVIPQGEPNRPAATKISEAQFPGITMDGMFTELMRVVDFAPGVSTGLHVHNGPTFLLMLDGTLTLRQDGGEKVYKAGESWMEMPDHVHEAINTSDTTARLIAIYLLPMAAPATSVKQ